MSSDPIRTLADGEREPARAHRDEWKGDGEVRLEVVGVVNAPEPTTSGPEPFRSFRRIRLGFAHRLPRPFAAIRRLPKTISARWGRMRERGRARRTGHRRVARVVPSRGDPSEPGDDGDPPERVAPDGAVSATALDALRDARARVARLLEAHCDGELDLVEFIAEELEHDLAAVITRLDSEARS
jgi:hypothetical protein